MAIKKKKQTKKVSRKQTKKTSAKKAAPTVRTRRKKAEGKPAVKRTSAQKKVAAPTEATSLVGVTAPKMVLPATGGQNLSLSDFSGKRVVLYFYPKDNTPGCTVEGYDFKRLHRDFEAAGTVILGVSKDSLKSHDSFRSKCGFPFDLIVDQDEKLCRAFDVIQMKSLYGRQYLGVERSTFVIDEKGKVIREWRKVKVNGHAEEVLDFVRTL